MTVEEKAGMYAAKTEAEYGFDMHPKTASFQGFIAGYAEAIKDLSENKFNPDDYECLAGVCPDLSDENHCETCTLKRLMK